MMNVVVDTNVILVANGQHQDVTEESVIICTQKLQALKENGLIFIDDLYRIMAEYQNKTQPNKGTGAGDAFLKWLLQNMSNTNRVQQVTITEIATNEYAEFPDSALQPDFDAPDRKFAAVANAHPDKPPIWQAVDCKWLNWWPALHAKGVMVVFLCPDDIRLFYRKKFPRRPVPLLPTP